MKLRYRKKMLAIAVAAMSAVMTMQAQTPLNYQPDGKDFVAVNGRNLFTKPLHNGNTGYCVRTSDTPLFRLSKGGKEKMLSFAITLGDRLYQLGSVARCESRFSDGCRRYLLSDEKAWGQQTTIEMTICPLASSDGAIIKFLVNGVDSAALITANLEGQLSKEWKAQGESYLEIDDFEYSGRSQSEMAKTFTIAQRWNKAAAERIAIETPDSYINNAMGPLLSACHGSWNKYYWIDGDFSDMLELTYPQLGDNNSVAAITLERSLANYMGGSPTRAFEMMRSTLVSQMYEGDSPAMIADDAVGYATRDIVQGLFGVQPDASGARCIIRPGMPREWKSASIRTPYLIYKYHRVGGRDIYEVTQNFDRPMNIVIRQNIGNGKYQDVMGSNKKHQIISLQAIAHDIEDAPDFTEPKKKVEDTLLADDKCQQIKLDKLFNHECRTEHASHFAIPFRARKHGNNVAVASTAKGYNVGFDIKAKGKYKCAYLLVTGKSDSRLAGKESGQVIATYSDGEQQTLSIVNPTNWTVTDYEDHCLLAMPLNANKKLKTISIVALTDNVEIGLEALTLINM